MGKRYRDRQLELSLTGQSGLVRGRLRSPKAVVMTRKRETMNDENFTATFTVDQTPEEAFGAIKNVRGWWSEEIEGSTEKLGDEFTYRFKDVHNCKMKLIEFIPHKKVVWV